jgi:hypothetical protein
VNSASKSFRNIYKDPSGSMPYDRDALLGCKPVTR